MHMPMIVTSILSRTVRFRPILFINKADGIARMKNQRNTMEGKKPLIVSES